MNFLHDGALSGIDRGPGADETNLSLNITTTRWRDIDLTPGLRLHVLDGFSTCDKDISKLSLFRRESGILYLYLLSCPQLPRAPRCDR